MKKLLSLLIVAAILLSLTCCTAADDSDTPVTPEVGEEAPQLKITSPQDVTVILHAGGGLDGMRLLNCQEAFYEYYALGYRCFEYDLKLSSDGRLIGTHSWEHLSGGYDGISYADFRTLTLDGGYTPVNEEWLIGMLSEYADVTVVVDAKMDTALLDAEVIKRLQSLGEAYGVDLSSRIIPEVFSVEMWEAIREDTSFDAYLFSRYKEYYSISTLIESFPTDRFIGVALPYDYLDGYYERNIAYLQAAGYRIFMFGLGDEEDVEGALSLGADSVYLDVPASRS